VFRSKLRALAASSEAEGKSDARLSIKLNDELYEVFQGLVKDTGLNKANLTKGIILQMKKDLLDDKDHEMRESLREILLLAG
jgi:predicted DNA-binding protein